MVIAFVQLVLHYCIVCVRATWYGIFVQVVYSTVCTLYHGWCISTISRACTTPVRPTWYGSFRTPGLQYSSTVLTIASASVLHVLHVLQYTPRGTVLFVRHYLYRIVCMYTLRAAATVVSVHPLYSTVCTMLVQRFNIAQFASIVVSHLFCKIDHHFLPQTSFFSFLSLSAFCSPMSCSLSFLVSLSIVVLSFLSFVISP
jgi:hypothetical protein